jgi:hypothetical protein
MADKGSFLTNDQFLRVGDWLTSPNGRFVAQLRDRAQFDIVTTGVPYVPPWSTGVSSLSGYNYYAILQSDGNFCIYRGTGPNDNQGGVWCSMAHVPSGGRFVAMLEDDGCLAIYKGTGPNDKQGLLWSTQTAGTTLIERYAPKLYLHPHDKSRPDSVENYFNTAVLKGPDGWPVQPRLGAPAPSPVTADVLCAYNDPNAYLEFSNGQYPTAGNNFSTGARVVAAPNGQSGVGVVSAPVYVKSFRTATHIDIKYCFFYPFQSFQTFRVGVRTGFGGFETKKRNFEWSRFGRHGGDWEHLTVRLDLTGQRMLGAFYSRHKECVWVEKPPLVDGTHPVVRVALNSHANYTTVDTFTTDNALAKGWAWLLGTVGDAVIPGISDLSWAKVVDTTSTDGLVTYDPAPQPFGQVEWTPYANPGQLVILDKNPEADKWLDFQGHWGPPKMDNREVERPPALPRDLQDALLPFAKTSLVQGKLDEEQKFGNGPKSPKMQNWWMDKEP